MQLFYLSTALNLTTCINTVSSFLSAANYVPFNFYWIALNLCSRQSRGHKVYIWWAENSLQVTIRCLQKDLEESQRVSLLPWSPYSFLVFLPYLLLF